MHSAVRFILAGQIEDVAYGDPTQTVLEYLREQKGLCGTKEGCAEGDCGACTVVIGELHGEDMRYQAVNSCIQFVPALDGKQLICVEDLATPGTNPSDLQLHAVQQAMVDQHGSQCGFCTPGFVMSLFAMFHSQAEQAITRDETELGLAGNLCRCTGYAPIVRAAEQALIAGRSDRFTPQQATSITQLRSIRRSSCLAFGEAEFGEAEFGEAEFSEAGTKSNKENNGSSGHGSADPRMFYAPRSIATLCELLQTHPRATMVAGATDVGLWVNKKLQQLETIIFLGEVAELKQLQDNRNYLNIGAAVTYADAYDRICDLYPSLAPLINRIGGAQVRNAGTIGGNIANGSPIGDMPPALIVLAAKLVLCSAQGQREIDLEDFFIEYGKQDLRPGECVQQIRLPKPPAKAQPDKSQLFATYKISKRIEQDISALCAAFALRVEDGLITQARVCYGGMAGTPKRASHCETALKGQPFVQKTITAAMQALRDDYTPMSDMRASANYRMRVAQNLLQRFYLEHSDVDYPVQLETSGHA